MKPGSSIINSTSVAAYKGNPKLLDCTATKGAIVAFTRGLALQLVSKRDKSKRCSAGSDIWTPLVAASFSEEEIRTLGTEVPMERAAQPMEVAPTYVFIACDHCASHYTGQVFHPNGTYV